MNVPKLRFKEFNDKWKPINLANAFQYFSTNSFSREQLSESGILKNLHYGDIHRKYNSIVNENKDITSYIKDINYVNKYELLKNNDLIFADASEDYEGIGKAVEVVNVNNNTVSGLHTILARDNSNVFAPMFKGYYFNSPIVHKQVRVLANGFKVYGISRDSINKLNIRIPSIQEQSKIANTLYLLDKKIELQTKKIEDLKLFKKGLDQSIFNNKTLFKQELFKNLFDSDGGTALEKYISKDGTHKIISIGNYSTNGLYIDNGQRITLNDKTKTKLLDKDNLVMILNDKTTSGDIIGSTILIDKDNHYIYNQRSQKLICKNIDPKYAWSFLNSNTFRKRIFQLSQGGTQIYVNFPTIEKETINIPKDENISNLIINSIFSIYKKIISLPRKVTGFTLRRKGEKYQIIAISNPGGKKVIATFDNYPQAN